MQQMVLGESATNAYRLRRLNEDMRLGVNRLTSAVAAAIGVFGVCICDRRNAIPPPSTEIMAGPRNRHRRSYAPPDHDKSFRPAEIASFIQLSFTVRA